jgi:predicted hydrocarbon binding protein
MQATTTPSTLPSINDLLIRGKQAAMQGRRDLAREMLAHVVYLEPANAEGWLWLSGVVDLPEQVRYCLERTLRIDPRNGRALRGIEWLDARQREIDEARAAAERVKPYWQTSKPKPLLNLIKGAQQQSQAQTATGETASRKPASWTSIGLTLPGTRVARSNLPTMPVSPSTLDNMTTAGVSRDTLGNPTTRDNITHISSRSYRQEVLGTTDELSPRFVTNFALRNLLLSTRRIIGDSGFSALLQRAGLEEYEQVTAPANEDAAANYTRFSAFTEALEDFLDHAVEPMEIKLGREMFRQELANKGKMTAMKGISFKLMAPEKKLEQILMELADAHARMGMDAYFEEQEGGYMFVIERCPYCFGRLTNARCNITSGFLAAGIEWATGNSLQIQEVSCRGVDEPFCGYWIPTAS